MYKPITRNLSYKVQIKTGQINSCFDNYFTVVCCGFKRTFFLKIGRQGKKQNLFRLKRLHLSVINKSKAFLQNISFLEANKQNIAFKK